VWAAQLAQRLAELVPGAVQANLDRAERAGELAGDLLARHVVPVVADDDVALAGREALERAGDIHPRFGGVGVIGLGGRGEGGRLGGRERPQRLAARDRAQPRLGTVGRRALGLVPPGAQDGLLCGVVRRRGRPERALGLAQRDRPQIAPVPATLLCWLAQINETSTAISPVY